MKQQDKKEILGSFVYGFVIVIAILSIGWASQGKFGVLWSSLIQPLVQGTGQWGLPTNCPNSVYADSFMTNPTIGGVNSWCMLLSSSTSGGSGLFGSDSVSGLTRATSILGWSRSASAWYSSQAIQTGYQLRSYGDIITTSGDIYSSKVSGKIYADTGKFMTVKTAKDTCLEVALFTRTCTRDTLAFMTGADSLTAIYIVSPFATRGAMTRPPYVAGVVGGKLVIDRAAADTAFFDRYSVLKIVQR